MNWTEHDLAQLKEYGDATVLRDMYHTDAWKLYCRIARERIDRLTDDYLREPLSQEDAWEARVRLRAIRLFQQQLEDLVAEAGNLVDRTSVEQLMYSLSLRQQVE